MKKSESIFAFCECFFEKRVISAARWLKKLEHELSLYKMTGSIPSERFIDNVNFLLIDDAVEWAKTNSNAARLLKEEKLIFESIIIFKTLFQERFSAKTMKSSIVNFHVELKDLRQGSNKIINAYYKRVLALMSRVAVKDCLNSKAERLSPLKKATLSVILKSFARDLHDVKIRKKIIKNLIIVDRFFRQLYSLAENTNKSKKKLQKLMKKKIDRLN